MAISSGNSGGVSGVTSEINVTPMADIMLVLLIIFMITTPLLQKGITVNLPKAHNVIDMPQAEKRDALVIGMDRSMRLYLGNRSYDEANLRDKITEFKEVNQPDQAYFKCDQSVVYDRVIKTLELIQETGFEQIGLLVDQQK